MNNLEQLKLEALEIGIEPEFYRKVYDSMVSDYNEDKILVRLSINDIKNILHGLELLKNNSESDVDELYLNLTKILSRELKG